MEEHLFQLGRGLVRRGYPVAALCSEIEALGPLRDALTDVGVTVHCPAERHASALGAVVRLRDVVRTIRQYPGCIVHLHYGGHTGGELLTLAARLGGARAVIRTDHNPPDPPITARERFSVRLRDRTVDRMLFVSEQVRQSHVDLLGRDARKCRVVHNGVDIDQFSPRSARNDVYAQLGLDPSTPIVGTVSRLAERFKGNAHFLEMAAEVTRTVPAARFLIVGDGPLRPELELQARTLGIAEKVIFTGRVPTLPSYLAAMHVFVMPSIREGGPITVLEAMAMARPVVSTPVGMVPDVIQDHVSGMLVPQTNITAMAAAVLELLEDHEYARRLAERGRETVASRFSLDAMVDGVAGVYREVVDP
jgi:glycosyltransferase involved in cell wall biosynthesis